MDSYGRPQKFSVSRKQELQLQTELETLRNKPTTSRRKHRKGQRRPVCESKVTKLETTIYSDCKSTLLEKKLSPRTVVVGASSNVKFAITSCLNTSVPVQQARRKESRPKLLKPPPRVSKKQPSRRPITQTQTESHLSYQRDTIDDYNSVGSSNTTSNKQTLVLSRCDDDDSVASKSPSLNRSAGEQSYPASSADSSILLGPPQYFGTIFDNLSPKTVYSNSITASTHSSQPLSGALMLEVNMRFRSKETHVSVEHPLRDDVYDETRKPVEAIVNHSGVRVSSSHTPYMQLQDERLGCLPSSRESVSPYSTKDNEGQSRPVMQNEEVHVCTNDIHIHEKTSLPFSPKVDSDSDIFCVESHQEEATYNDTIERSSSTLEASEGIVFSIAGSMSSFGQPLSRDQTPSPSFDKSSRELSFSASSDTQTYPVSFQPNSQVGSTVRLLSNQKLATSSWLQAINSGDSKNSKATESDLYNFSGVSGEEVKQTVSVHYLADSDPSESFNQTVHLKPTAIASGSGSLKYEDVIGVTNDDQQITDDNIHEILAFSNSPVTIEDILNITGNTLRRQPRETMVSQCNKDSKLSFLSTWDSTLSHTSIHHFCMNTTLPQLPVPTQILSRRSHCKQLKQDDLQIIDDIKKIGKSPPNTARSKAATCLNVAQQVSDGHSTSNSQRSLASDNVAQGKLKKKRSDSRSLQKKKATLQYKVHDSAIFGLSGESMKIAKNPSLLLWTPAPPKLSLHPSIVQMHLFPNYKTDSVSNGIETIDKYHYGEKVEPFIVSQEDVIKNELSRLTDPIFRSVPNFSAVCTMLATQPDKEEFTTQAQLKEVEKLSEESSTAVNVESRQRSVGNSTIQGAGGSNVLQHTKSLLQLAPNGEVTCEKVEAASTQFNALMIEIQLQRERLIQYHKGLNTPKIDTTVFTANNDLLEDVQVVQESSLAASGTLTSRKLQRQFMRGTKRSTSKVGATGGRLRAIRRTKSAQIRAEQAREQLSQPSRTSARRGSFPLDHYDLHHIYSQQNIYNKQAATYKTPFCHLSLPDLTDERFDQMMLSQGANPGTDDPFKWAYGVWWDRWFPEVLKECREAVGELYSGHNIKLVRKNYQTKPEARKKHSPVDIEEDWSNMVLDLADVDPVWDQVSDSEVKEKVEIEVSKLNTSIEQCEDMNMVAVHCCRRGAILRKLGKLNESLDDLNHALSIQSTFSDAYWHRHLLFLIQGNKKRAMEDLFVLLKQNKKHFGALRSKAALLLEKGDLSSAVYSLSQAIALHPDDSDSYFIRAEIYEKRGEVESALSDYARVSELDPSNIVALSRPAMHKFKRGMWAASGQHFAALLQRDPNNTEARIHRAKAHYNIGQYVEALQDLSAAIHLEPNQAQAFFHRAYLLRESQPKQALQDFSVSLLLDDSVTNVQAFVHRGVLYTQLTCYDEALQDFESAVKLKRSLPSPNVCAGLVHMLHKKNITRAIHCFSTAIFVDPTCIRAYLCRADAFQRDARFKLAILDYARASHLEPNNPTYYLFKGELHFHLGELDLASLHISIAAKLSTGFDQEKSQRALVDSFLGNYEQAIILLQGIPKTPEIYSMLGRIQFKAKEFIGSADSLKQAIYLAEKIKPSNLDTHADSRGGVDNTGTKENIFDVKTGFHFICGQSLTESGSLKEAVNEFSKVIQAMPDHALAYYKRGVAKLMDHNSKGILDLNKSLAINPKLFESFLARAAYYGKTGRYSKAILNCNEAIRLQPASVRAYLCRGALRYYHKMYDSAIEDLSRAIRLDSRHASLAHFNRAVCYQALGKLHMALLDYSVVFLLVESPKVEVLINRALLYLELGDWANSLFDFIAAGKVLKDDSSIFQAIGYCYHRLGSLDCAVDAYTEAINIDPTFLGAYIGRGNTYMDYLTVKGNSKSRMDYLRTLELDPRYLPARVNLAFLLQVEGKFQEAWNQLTSVLKTDEGHISAREARAVISLQMGNLFGALLDINTAIQVHKNALLLVNRGVIHQFMGDVVNAMNDYQEAVIIEPSYSLAHFNIGNILFQQRHFKQAVNSYTKAVGSESSVDSVLLNRAIAHVMLTDTKSALDDFREAILINPFSSHAYFNRANLYHSMGEFEKAELDYRKVHELQPDDWLTTFYYGETLRKINKDSSACNIIAQAVERMIQL
ncbi:uncharacterized protein LOC135346636 isoform X3 [Halichondria panicea]|uniref:uncharacterized protein LOC135346636 isoform X3 n=1 Tax=Halichondria panicea TaxID=6063 RepID=UPI00312B5DE2